MHREEVFTSLPRGGTPPTEERSWLEEEMDVALAGARAYCVTIAASEGGETSHNLKPRSTDPIAACPRPALLVRHLVPSITPS